ncbi:MAG: hypothetical protein MUC40_09800 [Akkermansiaceae bacterium]|nr:hypothetical protein [Akkermansiaceae bacterium]
MNPVRILLTTTSYQDIAGPHHELLEATGVEIVRERGPLPESKMLELAAATTRSRVRFWKKPRRA